MSTRATIGYMDTNKKLLHTVFLHFDGSYSKVWDKLANGYNSLEKAKELINNGAINGLEDSLSKTRFKKDDPDTYWGYQEQSVFKIPNLMDQLELQVICDKTAVLPVYDTIEDYFYVFVEDKWFYLYKPTVSQIQNLYLNCIL